MMTFDEALQVIARRVGYQSEQEAAEVIAAVDKATGVAPDTSAAVPAAEQTPEGFRWLPESAPATPADVPSWRGF